MNVHILHCLFCCIGVCLLLLLFLYRYHTVYYDGFVTGLNIHKGELKTLPLPLVFFKSYFILYTSMKILN